MTRAHNTDSSAAPDLESDSLSSRDTLHDAAFPAEQLRAEQFLRLRNRALEEISQGLLIVDALAGDYPLIFVNAAFERLTGYRQQEVLGRNPRFLQGPDTDRNTLGMIRSALRESRPCIVEILNYRKDGSRWWNELSVTPLHDETGRVMHFVGVQTDVTERRRLEEQLRRSQKLEAVGRLAGGVAHDFNNFLQIISGYAEAALLRTSSSNPLWPMLEGIRQTGERAIKLTGQLLALSRGQPIAARIIPLNEVICSFERILGRLIGEDTALVLLLDPNLAPVRGDPGQVEQVLMNLAVNAKDAMPNGGKLVIETRNHDSGADRTRRGAAPKPSGQVRLRVTDTGCGMTDEVKQHLFEPFFTTKRPGRGTGLGLAVVYGIVQQYGGHIEVESTVGAGTSFHIYLPACEKPG